MRAPSVLETERLLLRPIERADAPAVQTLVSDRRIAATILNIPHPYPPDGAATWIEGVLESQAQGKPNWTFMIIRKADAVLMGVIGIHSDPTLFRAEIGYWLGAAYWNQGYMSEAARCIVQFGFEAIGLNRIYACYFTHNPASAQVMQKIGMTYEGVMRQHIVKWGEFIDLGWYSILRSEFEAQKAGL